jgi:hypothetical protein
MNYEAIAAARKAAESKLGTLKDAVRLSNERAKMPNALANALKVPFGAVTNADVRFVLQRLSDLGYQVVKK